MSPRRSGEALVLDEMFPPSIAEELRRRGLDVIAVVADPQLRAMSDPELYEWAGQQGRRIVTENVKDFRPLLVDAAPGGAQLLFTSSRSFPRSRKSIGPLLAAVEHWLRRAGPRQPEEWLQPAPKPSG